MSFHSEFASDVFPDLLDEFGETLTRVTSDETTQDVTATVEMQGEEWNDIEGLYEERGTIYILSTVDVERDDKWTVHGRTFKVERIHLPQSGMRQVDLIAKRKLGRRP